MLYLQGKKDDFLSGEKSSPDLTLFALLGLGQQGI